MVAPIEKRERTLLFMTRTDWAFNFSNIFSIILALYFLSLALESITKISAVVGSTPMSYLKAYYHISVISSKEPS